MKVLKDLVHSSTEKFCQFAGHFLTNFKAVTCDQTSNLDITKRVCVGVEKTKSLFLSSAMTLSEGSAPSVWGGFEKERVSLLFES